MDALRGCTKNGDEIEMHLDGMNMESWNYFYKNDAQNDTIKKIE